MKCEKVAVAAEKKWTINTQKKPRLHQISIAQIARDNSVLTVKLAYL